jgi:hypothetical protein
MRRNAEKDCTGTRTASMYDVCTEPQDGAKHAPHDGAAQRLISPQSVSKLLDCSRSSVDRIARREGWERVLIGEGRNGLVRYRLVEVLRYIDSRSSKRSS